MIPPHFKQKSTTSQKIIEVAIKCISVMTEMIGIGLSDSRFIGKRAWMTRKISAELWKIAVFEDSLESLSKSWVVYSRELVINFKTLSPKIHFLELLSSTPPLINKYIVFQIFDKGVLNNSRKAFLLLLLLLLLLIN